MTTYKALVDLVVAGKGVKAGSTFEASDEAVSHALGFGLAEVAEHVHVQQPKTKPTSKRGTARRAS